MFKNGGIHMVQRTVHKLDQMTFSAFRAFITSALLPKRFKLVHKNMLYNPVMLDTSEDDMIILWCETEDFNKKYEFTFVCEV